MAHNSFICAIKYRISTQNKNNTKSKNTMNLTKLEKASKILEDIKLLDKQIIEIDRFAMMVAGGHIKSNFELRVEDLKPKLKEKSDLFDEDGSLKIQNESSGSIYDSMRYSGYMPIFSFHSRSPTEKNNDNESILKYELSERSTLQILGIILLEKKDARQTLINHLERFGVQI